MTPFVAELATWHTLYWALSLLVGWRFLAHLRCVYRRDLKSVPGPRAARWTAFWRPWALRNGDCPEIYHGLHQKYGSIVRTAPSVVSISDPKAIPVIYGIGTKFYKVSVSPWDKLVSR